jgi:fatty-acyl-CoA synthase
MLASSLPNIRCLPLPVEPMPGPLGRGGEETKRQLTASHPLMDCGIRGGENIYPREIEEFLFRHPDVVDVQVIGVPSERYGEETMAWIRPAEGARLTEEAMLEYCRGQIATFKIPRYWKFVDEFPMTVTGKVQKFRMREMAIDELGLQRAADTRTA